MQNEKEGKTKKNKDIEAEKQPQIKLFVFLTCLQELFQVLGWCLNIRRFW